MALVRFGGGITAMSGSIAGNTFAHNRFGRYIRARTKPTNPKSDRQNKARAIIMMLAEQWREDPMDNAIRLAWQTYADSCNWNNKLGEPVKLTGFNMFIQCNAARMIFNRDLITAGPAALGLPAGDPKFQVQDVEAAGNTYAVAFDDDFDWVDEIGGFLMVYAGQPQSQSRNFFGGPWRYVGRVNGKDAPPPDMPAIGMGNVAWTQTEGQKIWWRGRIVRADGRISNLFRCNPTIVVA